MEPVLLYTGRKVYAVKKNRVTEKESAKTRVKNDSRKTVKIDSFMDDEVNVGSAETNVKQVCNFSLDSHLNVIILGVLMQPQTSKSTLHENSRPPGSRQRGTSMHTPMNAILHVKIKGHPLCRLEAIC